VRRQGLATPDKGHLHHRLMNLGHGHRRSVAILWAWTGLLSGFVLWPVYNDRQGDAIVPFGVAAFALLLLSAFHPRLRSGRDDSAEPDLEASDASVDTSNVRRLDEARRTR